MITEQELKDKCTPKIIKQMCEYAEGFEFEFATTDGITAFSYNNKWYSVDHIMFGLLLHRTVEGWNNRDENTFILIDFEVKCIRIYNKKNYEMIKKYWFRKYTDFTPCECAILDCLLDVFEEVGK